MRKTKCGGEWIRHTMKRKVNMKEWGEGKAAKGIETEVGRKCKVDRKEKKVTRKFVERFRKMVPQSQK